MSSAPVAVVEALGSADVGGADVLRCNDLLRDLKRLRGWVDAKTAEVTSRLDVLARQGESFGSEASHGRCSGMSSREAARHKNRAEAIANADGFGEALSSGDVTAEHVDKLASVASGLSDDVRASLFDKSGDLLAHATLNDPGRFGRHVRDLANRLEADAGISRDQQQRAATFLTVELNTASGMYDVRGALHPELGARVKRMLRLQVAKTVAEGERAGLPEYADRNVNRNRVMAEALGELLAAGHGEIRPTVAEIVVLVDQHTLDTGAPHDHTVCESSDGAALPIESVRGLLCLGRMIPVVTGSNGTTLAVGRTTRAPNRAQRRALRAMYRTCACHGCDVEFDRCELHHILPWEAGGPTDLDNLLPVCSRHHHLLHALSWRLHLAPDRTLTITDRTGTVVMVTTPDVPHPARPATPTRAPSDQLAS